MKTYPDDLLNQNKKYSEDPDKDGLKCISSGLTKREYFAAMAMQGMLANSHDEGCNNPLSKLSNAVIAHLAVLQAECLIEELNK